MDDRKILQGDCIDVLKTLPDGIADMCVTSPPYYGLRDYGTGKWIGGDPNCPHRRVSKFSDKTITGHHQTELAGNVGDAIYKHVCPLCGAIREDKQIGLEETPEAYVERLVGVFQEIRRVLKDDGTLWLNIGDSYCGTGDKGDYKDPKYEDGRNGQSVSATKKLDGYKQKDLIGIPWMLAFALRNDGWYLRQDIIWAKPNPMPEPVKDRCTKSHEYLFLLSKSRKYYFDSEAIAEPVAESTTKRLAQDIDGQNGSYTPSKANGLIKAVGNGATRNKRDVWNVPVQATKEAHFATYPEKLVEPCILAGSRPGGVVIDPFFGSGTTGRVATKLGRDYIGIELNPEYVEIAKKRTDKIQPRLF